MTEKLWLFLTAIIAIIVYIQSNAPSIISNEEFYDLQFDKIVHMSVWITLSFSLRLGINRRFNHFQNEHTHYFLAILIILSTFYGITDEIHQLFVPSRSSDIFDVLADFLGSIIGVLIGHALVLYYEEKKE